MRILQIEEANAMSVIIGVCGTNFCSFIADGRLVVSNNAVWKTAREDFQKIIKLNDRLIYGVTGVFNQTENLLDPFSEYPDKSVLTMPLAYKAILRHAEKTKEHIPCARNYLLGGKDNKGNFCVHEIHINFETYQVETAIRKPEQLTATTSTFGLSCALPAKLSAEKAEWVDKIGKCVLGSTHHAEMVEKVSDIIKEIADRDETVGKNVYTLTVQ